LPAIVAAGGEDISFSNSSLRTCAITTRAAPYRLAVREFHNWREAVSFRDVRPLHGRLLGISDVSLQIISLVC
jgi:hypothetical protein